MQSFRNTAQQSSGTSFYDEEERELMNRYIETKNSRKRAEEEAQMLQNRVNLLLQEEMKATKQVHDTRNKVKEILNNKLQRQKSKMTEESLYLEKAKQERQQLELVKARRNQSIEGAMIQRTKMYMKKKQDVEKFKEALQEQKAHKENTTQQHLEQTKYNIKLIQEQKRRHRITKEAQKKEREIVSRISFSNRTRNDSQMTNSRDMGSQGMNRFERDLLYKLQSNQQWSDDEGHYYHNREDY